MDGVSRHYFSGDPLTDLRSGAREAVRNASMWAMTAGVLLILLGALAVYFAFAATLTMITFLGAALIVGGIFHGVSAFSHRNWTPALIDAMACILYLIAGTAALRQPLVAAGVVTLVLSVLYMFQGIMRLIASIALHPVQWGWMALNGVVTFCLGLMIFSQWPTSALWLLGVVVGVDMLLSGFSMFMGGRQLRHDTQVPERARL